MHAQASALQEFACHRDWVTEVGQESISERSKCKILNGDNRASYCTLFSFLSPSYLYLTYYCYYYCILNFPMHIKIYNNYKHLICNKDRIVLDRKLCIVCCLGTFLPHVEMDGYPGCHYYSHPIVKRREKLVSYLCQPDCEWSSAVISAVV